MQDREIKFRAWDGSRMIHFEDFSIGLTKGKKVKPYVYFLSDTFNGEVKLGKHKIMQWTGLLDKDANEIYEGDILQHLNSESTTIKKVVFDSQMAAFILRCDKYFQPLQATYGDEKMYADTYRIIGNIYKNPELLSAAAKTEAKPVL